MFLTPWFAVAGLIAAAGPILIHLLNRRRYKVRQWAAMEFLREAVVRSRRILQLRDLLLLALRTACILAFGLAMAQPFFGSFRGTLGSGQGVHAVLLLDNSLSMGYVIGQEIEGQEQRDRTLLDEAKRRAEEVIDGLPTGSRISVLPTCGPTSGYSNDAYYTKEEALKALSLIQPVDQETRPHETIDRALAACDRVRDPAGKKIVFLTDRQVADWPAQSLADRLKGLPAPVEVVQVEPDEPVDNAWISSFATRDGITDLRNPAVFLARISYEGPAAKRDVEVTLWVNGQTVETQTVDLQPGSASGREIRFQPYPIRLSELKTPGNLDQGKGEMAFVTAKVSISARQGETLDGLSADDERFLVVPVVATLPVVLIDQLGRLEDPQLDLLGETARLRHLLTPKTGRSQRDRHFVELKKRQIHEVDRSLLEDARLVVIAGVASPGASGTVQLLREYVEQGGNLVIAAGANFDPRLWNEEAWLDGLGILPAPLGPESLAFAEGEELHLDYNSLKSHDYFLIQGDSEEFLQKFYHDPEFFKVIEAIDDDDHAKEEMVRQTEQLIEQRRERIQKIDRRLAELREMETKQQQLTADDRDEQAVLEDRRGELQPSWLLWSDPAESAGDGRKARHLAEETRFSVLARYDNGLPFMIERRIGRGKVLLVTTGVYPSWNTMALTDTFLVFDLIFRDMLQCTLPERNISSQGDFVLPVSAATRSARITLTGPGQTEELLSVGALGAKRYGITVGGIMRRGLYHLTARRSEAPSGEGLGGQLWTIPLAVNGPPEESQLLTLEEIRRRSERGNAGAVTEMASVFSLGDFQQTQLRWAKSWKWAAAAVLVCLLLELVVLARAARSGERTA